MLNKKLLICCIEHLKFQPEIDFFASRINHQFPKYVSYRCNPHAVAIVAFTILGAKLNFYAFPPFSVIPMVLNKIKTEQATGIVVLPNWLTQPWYPIAIRMLKQDPIHLKPSKDLLHLPSLPEKLHPLSNKLNLMVCLLVPINECKVRLYYIIIALLLLLQFLFVNRSSMSQCWFP